MRTFWISRGGSGDAALDPMVRGGISPSIHDDQQIIGGHLDAFFDENVFNGSIAGGGNGGEHLHGLDDDELVACLRCRGRWRTLEPFRAVAPFLKWSDGLWRLSEMLCRLTDAPCKLSDNVRRQCDKGVRVENTRRKQGDLASGSRSRPGKLRQDPTPLQHGKRRGRALIRPPARHRATGSLPSPMIAGRKPAPFRLHPILLKNQSVIPLTFSFTLCALGLEKA